MLFRSEIFKESLERLIIIQENHLSAVDALYSFSDSIPSTLHGVVECSLDSLPCHNCKGEGCIECHLSGLAPKRFSLTSIIINEEMKAKIREGKDPLEIIKNI